MRCHHPGLAGSSLPLECLRLRTALVIPCHDQCRFLGEAIESALAQSPAFDELVVVDDGSSDDTAAVAARHPQVRLVQQPRRGLSAARNRGLAETSADVVAFLDADDRLLPGALASGLDALARAPGAAFAYGSYRNVDECGAPLSMPLFFPCSEHPYEDFLHGNPVGMHGAVLYRRAPLVAAGGFDEGLTAGEDYDLYLRLARCAPVASHDSIVAEYRRHPNAMSRDPARMLLSTLRVQRRQRPFVRGDAALERAWREGMQITRRTFGPPLFARVAEGWRGLRPSWRDTGALLLAPGSILRAVRRRLQRRIGATGRPMIAWGDLRRLDPVSRSFGYDRGTPIDRHYIERFLAAHAACVRGRVLEIGDDHYTRRFGGSRVARADVLHVRPDAPGATIVSDLATGAGIPDAAFDCLLVTQTLHLVYDVHAAVRTLHRILRPGGTLLLTVPGTISQLEQGEWRGAWCWGFAPTALERLFAEVFGSDHVQVASHGNVVASVAFLQGLAAEELSANELAGRDALYPLLLTVRAVKDGGAGR